MSKEKTRAELHAEIKELKEKYAALEADRDSQHELAMEWQTKWSILYDEHEACEKSLNHANDVIEQKIREIACLNKALKLSGEANDKLIQERDAAKARVERMQADLDKAQYIAADLLEHGVFHFLIVKYSNLKNK